MAIPIHTTRYRCTVCETIYDSEKEAKHCESKSVSKDKGAKVGDIIIITKGDGAGQEAKVTSRFVYDKGWGHYMWERYWHTVGLTAKLVDSWGNRQLTFDDYKLKGT